jgi:preprotein translocase subunit SecF
MGDIIFTGGVMLERIFDRKLLIFPVLLLAIAGFSMFTNYQETGHFVERSVELQGGSLITIVTEKSISAEQVESLLAGHEVSVRSITGFTSGVIIQTTEDPQQILEKVRSSIQVKGSSVETVGPVLGESFFAQAQLAVVIAFALMSLTVFIIFRKAGPSLAVIAAAGVDMVVTLGLLNIVGIPLSLATFAALLLLIGYSVDTNILLTSQVLKSGKSFNEATLTAMKTGITMTATTFVAMFAVLLAPTSNVLNQIAITLIIGILVDNVNTWITNVQLLKFMLKR